MKLEKEFLLRVFRAFQHSFCLCCTSKTPIHAGNNVVGFFDHPSVAKIYRIAFGDNLYAFGIDSNVSDAVGLLGEICEYNVIFDSGCKAFISRNTEAARRSKLP